MKRLLKMVILTISPIIIGLVVYSHSISETKIHVESRIAHPAVPIEYRNLVDPFKGADPATKIKFIEEGRLLFQKNCRPCHGAKAMGDGPMAVGFTLKPADLTDPSSIKALGENYAFWRIKEGGIGLPPESTPWNSPMPRWKKELTDEEIWKIIMALEAIIEEKPSNPYNGNPIPKNKIPVTEEAINVGKRIYQEDCTFCHGPEGKGDGPLADYLDPRPRNLAAALYKFRSTAEGELPTDEDIFRIIVEGISYTSMPSWNKALTEEEIWQVIYYTKTFNEDFSNAEYNPYERIVSVKEAPHATDECIAEGKRLFDETQCWECHGKEGRGNGPSALTAKDNWGYPIRPRNLTKSWHYKGGNTLKDIYMRISTGISGTPMPSYTDSLSEEQRWHVGHYIESLIKEYPKTKLVLKAKFIEGNLPMDPSDPLWEKVDSLEIPLSGQVTVRPRWQNPSADLISVKCVFNKKDVAFLLEWDDSSKDIVHEEINSLSENNDTYAKIFPLNGKKEKLRDAVAIQFPVKISSGVEKPYLLLGSPEKSVTIWYWKADKQYGPKAEKAVEELNAQGYENPLTPQPEESQWVRSKAIWESGKWKVVMFRSLAGHDPKKDISFEPWKSIPMVFYTWNGFNGEKGLKMAMSSWYYLVIEPPK